MNTWAEPTTEELVKTIRQLESEKYYYKEIVNELIFYSGNKELEEKFAAYLQKQMDICKESIMDKGCTMDAMQHYRDKYEFYKNLLDQI